MMMEDIFFNNETTELKLSNELLEKIKYLIENSGFIQFEIDEFISELDEKQLYYGTLIHIINKVTASVNRLYEFYVNDEEIPSINNDLYNQFLTLIKKYDEYNPDHLDKPIKRNRKNMNETLNALLFHINTIYEIKKQYKKLNTLRDLYRIKDDCYKNMTYFKKEEEIKLFMSNYLENIKLGRAEEAKNMLLTLQKEILSEWKKYDGNFENMTDDNFCFIGHSTASTKFNNNFFDSYVSTSLFNQDINDTYRRGYGFIMPPINIVGAKSEDMYVNNIAGNDEKILAYSLVPQIDHPKRVLEETLQQKEKNIQENNSKKVYSEVVQKGFSPIGLFCFTDGTLTLDPDYNSFMKLKEDFPNLKFKIFDTFKRKKGIDLVQAKLRIINNLERDYFGKDNIYNYSKIEESELERYEYFFKEFNKLKEKDFYNEDDIRKIYKKNKDYIGFLFYFDELFTEKYTDEERMFILGNNYSLNINRLLSGDVRKFDLKSIGNQLKKHIGKLNKYYNGLDEFVTVMNKITLGDDLVNEIKKLDNINFYTITKLIIDKKKNDLQSSNAKSKNNFDILKEKYTKYKTELKERETKKEEYEYYQKIDKNAYIYNLAIININMIKDDNTYLIEIKKQLEMKLFELKKQLQILENKKKNNNFEEEQDYKDMIQKISELTQIQIKLKKHPFLNIKKLKKNKEEIIKYNSELSRKKEIFVDNKRKENIHIQIKIDFIKEQINHLQNEISKNNQEVKKNNQQKMNLENEVQKTFGLSLKEIEILIKKANKYLQENSSTENKENDFSIQRLNQAIEKILPLLELEKNKMNKNNQELRNIDELEAQINNKHQTK